LLNALFNNLVNWDFANKGLETNWQFSMSTFGVDVSSLLVSGKENVEKMMSKAAEGAGVRNVGGPEELLAGELVLQEKIRGKSAGEVLGGGVRKPAMLLQRQMEQQQLKQRGVELGESEEELDEGEEEQGRSRGRGSKMSRQEAGRRGGLARARQLRGESEQDDSGMDEHRGKDRQRGKMSRQEAGRLGGLKRGQQRRMERFGGYEGASEEESGEEVGGKGRGRSGESRMSRQEAGRRGGQARARQMQEQEESGSEVRRSDGRFQKVSGGVRGRSGGKRGFEEDESDQNSDDLEGSISTRGAEGYKRVSGGRKAYGQLGGERRQVDVGGRGKRGRYD